MARDRTAPPIAIVGAAARFPGASDLAAFWRLLEAGRDAIGEIPDSRWAKDFFFHPEPGHPGKSYTWRAGVLDEIRGFDAAFFGVSPREAEQIDPQQRLLLELAWEAIEDGGAPAARLARETCGVYIGFSGAEYANSRIGDPAAGDAYFMTGTTGSIVANRISYVLDLKGPSFAVDTACSSSLVALDLACQALGRGEIGSALVGGVNLLLTPYPFIGFCRASMLSPTGRCHAFDARADGYVRAEGGGVVLLKPLDQALASGDPIRGVILGTAVNSDGRTTGISLPSPHAQAELLRKAYATAGVQPEAISFIECHGTGTQAGDPIELGALGEVIGQERSTPLPVGSVKTNIGHLETASGMAGLLKAVLAMEHRRLPKSLNFERPNPHIPFDRLNVEVAVEPLVLPNGSSTLVAGVNSFGFGGTNAHAVLASAPHRARALEAQTAALPPLLISARSEAALGELARRWSETLQDVPDEAAIGLIRGAARGRDHHRYRLSARGGTRSGLAEAIRQRGEAMVALQTAAADGRAVFVFSGNGSQWLGMGLDALEHSSAFGDAMARADRLLSPQLGWSVLDRLRASDPENVASTRIAQPLLFAVQMGVVEALAEQGLRPAACVGHSVGEIAAAWAAGRLSLEDACRIVVVRSREQERTRGAGSMMALGLSADAAARAVARLGLDLEVAAINSCGSVTIAGAPDELRQLVEEAQQRGWRHARLALDYAFHSRTLDPIEEGIVGGLQGLALRAGDLHFVSTVAGETAGDPALDARYWWRNVRRPVHFAAAIDRLIGEGHRLFVEIGPAPILQSYLREQLADSGVEGRTMPTLTRQSASSDPFPGLAEDAYRLGYDLWRDERFEGPVRLDGLPRYPWRREPFWVGKTTEAVALIDPARGPSLLGFSREPGVWTSMLDPKLSPWILDHKIEDTPVLPAAAMAEMALAAARAMLGEEADPEVIDLDFVRPLAFEIDRPREIRVTVGPDRQLVIESRPRLSEDAWVRHASASVRLGAGAPPIAAPFAAAGRLDAEEIYGRAAGWGLNYGGAFRAAETVDVAADGYEVRVTFDTGLPSGLRPDTMVEPSRLDAALHGLFALLDDEARAGTVLLPSRMGRVRAFGPPGRLPSEARLRLTRRGVRSVSVDIDLFDDVGRAVAAVREAWLTAAPRRADAWLQDRSYRQVLIPSAPAASATPLAASIRDRRGGDCSQPVRSESVLLLEAYLAAASHAALSELTGSTDDFTLEEPDRTGRVAVGAEPLLPRVLDVMASHGLAEQSGAGWRLAPTCPFGAPELIWRTLLAEHPDLAMDLASAAQAVASLKASLGGGGSGVAGEVEPLASGTAGRRRMLAALAEEAAELISNLPEDQPVRLLELGLVEGDLRRAIERRMGGRPANVVHSKAADLAAVQGRPFDLVLASDWLTNADDPERELVDLRGVMAEGAAALIVEPEPSFMLDLCLGRDPRWWRASLSAEFPIPAARSALEWAQLMESASLRVVSDRPLDAGAWQGSLFCLTSDVDAAPMPAVSAPGRVHLVRGEDGTAAALSEQAVAAGWTVASSDAPEPIAEGDQVVLIADGRSAGRPVAEDVARLVQVANDAAVAGARLWLVSRGAQLGGVDAGRGGALWGMGRTLCNETPEAQLRMIDLDPQLSADEAAARILLELGTGDQETEIAHDPGGRWVARLVEGLGRPAPTEGAQELSVARPGLLDTLSWRPSTRPASPGRDEVAIEVRAAGLNFRDLMWAQGLLPEEALLDGFAGATFGLECAGVVSAIGEGVVGISPGDRVIAFAPSAMASRVITAAHAVAPLPVGLDFEDGATLPVAYLTAIYALGRLAHLGPGEKVLIHAAAGGVGLAAIQYARHLGAEVIATAGSPLKREFLKACGADHIFDSRSLAFADQVMELTGGRGVDVVLNSLSGEAMGRSLELMAPFGRFLELGKRDFYGGGRVGLRPLRRNVSYFGVDADQLPARRPEVCASVMEETTRLIASGALTALPRRSFEADESIDAFRLMQGGGHIGKLVIVPPIAKSEPASRPAFVVRGDGTYLVTGGLTGLGLETARWLVSEGARHLALFGRRGADAPGAQESLDELRGAGVDVRAFACDIADAASLETVLHHVRAAMPPLRGLFHAAMVVDDGLAVDLTADRIEAVLRPKLDGAENLDRSTRADPLELFVLYSSATTALGAPGQGAYVAANAALESLARTRRQEGLPAMAVAFGPIADVGFLARDDSSREALSRRLSATPMRAADALAAIPRLWESGEAAPILAEVNWDGVRRSLPILRSPRFAAFADASGEAANSDVRARLAGMSQADAVELIAAVAAEELGRIMGSGAERIDLHRPLSELGVDSLMAVEFRLAVEARLGLELPMAGLADGVTLLALAGRIARGLDGGGSRAPHLEAITRHELASRDGPHDADAEAEPLAPAAE